MTRLPTPVTLAMLPPYRLISPFLPSGDTRILDFSSNIEKGPGIESKEAPSKRRSHPTVLATKIEP